MRKSWLVLVGVIAVGVGCTQNKKMGEAEEKDEIKLTMDQVPPEARAALQREAGGAQISSVDQEKSDGKTIYETDVMSGGKNWEIKVDAAGNVISKKIDNESEEKHGKKEKDED